MSEQLVWSIWLDIVGLIPIFLLGRKMRSGWLWYVAWMGMWVWYGIAVGAWGFIPSSIIYAIIYFHNWRKWDQ